MPEKDPGSYTSLDTGKFMSLLCLLFLLRIFPYTTSSSGDRTRYERDRGVGPTTLVGYP